MIRRKPGILQVLPALMSGGVEREVVEIAEGIQKAGYRSFVASSGGPMVNQLYKANARHFDLPLNSKNPFVMRSNVDKLVEIIAKHDIDVIHAQSRAPAWSAYFAAKKAGIHFVTTVHGAHGTKGPFKKFYNSIMTKGERVVAVSYFIADYLKENYEIDESKVEVIHCGTNIDLFDYKKVEKNRIVAMAEKLRLPIDKPIILVPGRLTRGKGHLVVLEALHKMPSKGITCLFLGDSKGRSRYREEVLRKAKEYELTNRVIVASSVTDMPAIYALSDIVISASTKPEAFGLVSIEAQAMGRMVIATSIGGSRETIIDGQSGWLVDPNDPDKLAGAITEALELDLPKRLYRAQLARNHVEKHFSLDSMCEKTINVYASLLR